MLEMNRLLRDLVQIWHEDPNATIPVGEMVARISVAMWDIPDGIPFDGDEFTKLTKGK